MIFSNHFKHTLKIIALIGMILFGVFLWFKHKLERAITSPSIPKHAGLRPDEREIITFNEKTHRVSVITSSGTVKVYARNPTVRIKKDGRVTVDRHMFGFEARPYIGIGYSDTTRGLLGFQPFYWGAFDTSVAVG